MTLERLYLTWQDVERLVERLEQQIGDVRRYDAMLVITRGGMVPACLLSKRTGMRNILVAAVMFYTDDGSGHGTLEQPVFLQFPPDPYLRGRTILVVDDVWDSGRTVMAVKRRIVDAGGRPVVAVLHYKPSRSHYPGEAPDFYAEETDAWIVYPWEPRPPS